MYNDNSFENYIRNINSEINYYKNNYNLNKLKTIYIGGGTPSIIPKNLHKLFYIVTSCISLNDIKEITIECNPCDINNELIKVLKEIGSNRLSIGIQSFNYNILNTCNRNNQLNKILNNAFNILENKNFDNISIDLINGLPGLDYRYELKELKKYLKRFNNIKHISFYDLLIEKKCKFYNNKEIKYPDESIKLNYEREFKNLLKEYGFIRYEISNYARKGYYSKHNLNYWKYKNYIGLGPSSHSTINNIRHENISDIIKYNEGILFKNIYKINKIEEIEEYLLMGFRLLKGIQLEDFYNRFNIKLLNLFNQTITKYFKLIKINKKYIRLNNRGLDILNTILIDFFKELDEKTKLFNL